MKPTNKLRISDLNSLGPQSRNMLEHAGIKTINQLQKMGSIAAFVKTRKVNENVSLNLLWALESALTGEHWQDIAKNHRTSLLLALEEYEQTQHNSQETNN